MKEAVQYFELNPYVERYECMCDRGM
jgi:hypothetical protein